MIVGKINQIGDFLTTENTNIANQYAENLQLEVSFDSKYDGYSWLWFCGYSYTQPKAVPILFDSTTSLITLPAEAFKHDGPLYVQAAVIKDGVKYTLEPVKFCIGQSLKQDFISHDPTETEILQALIREIVKNEYDGPLQELITEAGKQQTKANEQQETAEQQQKNAENMQAEAKKQQSEAERQQAEAERQQEAVNNLIGTSEQQQETITEQQSKVEELISEAQQQQETAIEQQDLAQQQQTNASNLQSEATRQQEVVNSLIVEAESQQTTAERQQTKTGEMQNALTLNLEEYKRALDAGEFIPEHKWEGSTIFFQRSDGTWGEGIDLNSPDLANYMLKSGGAFSGDVTFANGKTIKGMTKDGRSLTILCVYTEDSVLLGSPYLKTKLRSSTVPIWDSGSENKKIITEAGGELTGNLNLGNAVYLNAKKSDGGSLTIFGISDADDTIIGSPLLRSRIRSKVKPIWDNGGGQYKKLLVEGDAALGDTLPIGSVIYVDNDDELPAGYEKIDVIPPKQLLINNDFQINQRGQTNYATNGTYSLDMWLIKQGLTVNVISNGIRITQRDDGAIFLLQQFIQSEMFNNQSFTLNINCGGKVNSATFLYNDTNYTSSLDAPFVFENADVGIKVFNHEGKNVFQIYSKVKTLDIEYIDLFEGDVAYPHVREDKNIALMRCMEYLQVCYPFISLSKIWGNSRGSVLTCSYPLKANIKKNPTITGYSNIWIYSNDTTTNYDTSVNYTVTISNGKLEIRFTKKDGSIFTESNYSMSYQGKFIISSEPL